MHADKNLDHLLDAALATYCDEPTPEIAERILSRTLGNAASSRHSPTKDWKKWLSSALRWKIWLPAAAVLLLTAIFPFHIWQTHHTGSPFAIEHGPSPLPTPVPDRPQDEAAKAPSDFPVMGTHRHLSPHRSTPLQTSEHSEPLPKREVFPTPIPLSPQEQALQAVVNKHPEDISRSMADAAKDTAEPIQIVALKIPPLSPPDHGGN